MKVVKVQFNKLDKEYFFLPEFTDDSSDIVLGDFVIVDTALGRDIGQITNWAEFEAEKNTSDDNKNNGQIVQNSISDVKPMTKKATDKDLKELEDIQSNYHSYLTECRDLCRKFNLTEMKLIDVAQSFDNKRLTFYFVSDSRVDFRDLVKELVRIHHKKIRLQQVGVRDATKVCGGFGPCGMPLCCSVWLDDVGNVSPDFIKDQELSHRGADRLTGPCGRLKCCLRFEEEAYRYNLDKMPKEGDIIRTGAGKGKVVSVHPMKHTVELDINGARVEYPYLEGKLCEKVVETDKK